MSNEQIEQGAAQVAPFQLDWIIPGLRKGYEKKFENLLQDLTEFDSVKVKQFINKIHSIMDRKGFRHESIKKFVELCNRRDGVGLIKFHSELVEESQ